MRALRYLLPLLLTAAAPAPRCDEACLTTLADRYMTALAAQAPGDVPWAARVRFTENGVPMMIGDGLWGSMAGRPAKRAASAADPASGQVAWFGRVDEHGQPAFYAMRLKVTDGRIAEVETVIRRRQGNPPFGDAETFVLPAAPRQPLPAARIEALADGYYAGIAAGDGTALTRLAPACAATVNGTAAACPARLADRAIEAVRRRVALVDAAHGLALVAGEMDDPARDPAAYPRSLSFMALVRVAADGIARIDEIATEQPYLMPSPWKE
ncbi:MAG: hypothetical protein PGN09_00435 [Sphingomonas fennica]